MRKTPLKRRTPVKKVNRARKNHEFARTYHSHERVLFVKGLPCAACGVVGYSENAHIETGGMGRKADYTKIIPLCGDRVVAFFAGPARVGGCHGVLHNQGQLTLETLWGTRLARWASKTQKAWLLLSQEEGAK